MGFEKIACLARGDSFLEKGGIDTSLEQTDAPVLPPKKTVILSICHFQLSHVNLMSKHYVILILKLVQHDQVSGSVCGETLVLSRGELQKQFIHYGQYEICVMTITICCHLPYQFYPVPY